MILLVRSFFFFSFLFSLCQGAIEEESLFIGWQGEKNIVRSPNIGNKDDTKPWVEQISWKPRAYVYHNFLTKSEARHIVNVAGKHMKRSTVVGENDKGVVSNYRTSYGTFINRNVDAVIDSIEQRIALWTHLPPINQEDMQVLRYGATNKYGPHTDGLGRVATVLMYLVAPEAGGETAFINSEWATQGQASRATSMNLSDCAKGHVAFKPKMGDALLFYDRKPDYKTEDSNSEHTGCPVVSGVKWNAVKWIHGEPFNANSYSMSRGDWMHKNDPDPGMCVNRHSQCEAWANVDECNKNSQYMADNCALACKLCSPCSDNDKECINSNRAKAGYLILEAKELASLLD
uniref:Fe2OG dioxygenase domain-containing protein n=1 Tax=Polytomella parva TaxID=51329 RepID=A0A7S0YLU1_9CHLO|mmetsp:Transcript_32642/g.59191  ORF Transcript_32642/g.59191 Transcript_32642/m.59191 type:complete len:346 (+) Transcript_32642:82-1119(+)